MSQSTYQPKINTHLEPEAYLKQPLVHEVACNECCLCTLENRVFPNDLEEFISHILQKYDVPQNEANITAKILVASDTRGIPSHGVARLGRYIAGIKTGQIKPNVQMKIVESAPSIATVDAQNGLGQVAGEIAMELAITKAKQSGIGAVTVKNSNHYGIAGYYALKAVENNMIGVSLTNSPPLVVPTNGAEILLGSNPISLGAPANKYPAFLLDMATSVVPRGKLEVYDRNHKQMPIGWAVDEQGFDCQNPGQILHNLIHRLGGGILPLGGRSEEFSGYKGYGLAFLVEILSGILSGAAYGPLVNDIHMGPLKDKSYPFPNVGHFFLVLDIAHFIPIDIFKLRLDDLITQIKSSRKALDKQTIFIHGEMEFAKSQIYQELGIPLAKNVFDTLIKIAEEVKAPLPKTVPQGLICPQAK